MASSLGEGKRSPHSSLPTSSTPTNDPPSPVASGSSPKCVGQDQADDTATPDDQPQDVPASLVSTDETEEIGIPGHDFQTLAILDPSPDCAGQGQGEAGPTRASEQLLHVSSSSGAMDEGEEMDINIVQHSGQAAATSNSFLVCAGREQGEIPRLSEQPQHAASGPTEKNEEIIITAIQVTNVALGLRRLPAGFYVVLHQNGLEWKTENKPSSVNTDVVEWNGPIPISSDLSAVIRLEVYASFEYQPTLGAGEQLRTLRVTVGQLLDRSADNTPFSFFPKDGDVVSPCLSVLVTVKQQKHDPSGSRAIGPHWSTPDPRGELENMTNQAHNALTCYRKRGEKRYLEWSIQRFERALDTCPWDDPRRATVKSNLAIANLILSQVMSMDAPLETALWLHRGALAARPVGHPDRPLTLIQLASVHLARLQRGRNSVDGTDSENVEGLLREAIELSARDSYEKQAAVIMLRLCAGHRGTCVQPGDQSSMVQDPTPSLMDEDPWNLGVWLVERFERFGDLADLQRAISILEGLVRSMPIWDDDYCGALQNLGTALSRRFERLGQLGDLEEAISRKREAVRLSPDGHPDKPMRLNNLGISFQLRFERLGQLGDLEDAISTHGEAVRLTLDGHPNKPMYLTNLGNSFDRRFKHFGQLSDLEDAISRKTEAVRLTPDGHPNRPMYLSNLGLSFQTRFEHLGQLGDLDDAISRKREAVRLSPDDHPNNPGYLSNLGNSSHTRFLCLGQLSDLEDAIVAQEEAVRLSPDGHPDKPMRLNNLGTSFQTRFLRLGHLSDLEDAISSQRDAVRLTLDGHPNKPGYLSNLGHSFQRRFERLGRLSDLEDAASTHREAVHLSPEGHPDKPKYLINLGASFQRRFERLGQLGDLEVAISAQREAARLFPDGHPNKSVSLHNLGASLQIRFERLGHLSDLEDAIFTLREVVRLSPDGHPDKPEYFTNLGTSFQTRFLRLGQLEDLEDAILAQKQAVRLSPDGHPDKPTFLNNLGISFRIRFERLGQFSDLEDAILTQGEAVRLTPDGHPDKPMRLSNLGTSFQTHFECLGQLSDLEDAISRKKEAVRLTPDGHPNKSGYLNNLGNSFQMRFECLGQLDDLEVAISRKIDAVRITPHDHPWKPSYLSNLARSFIARFLHLRQVTDLRHALSLSSYVASIPIGPASVRFSAAQLWILCAQSIRHPSLLHAHCVATSLIPQLAWVGLPLSHRYDQLLQSADVVREAAAAALDAGFPEAALEFLEQGRSVIWGDLFQLRSSYSDLSSVHPEYASRLHTLSVQLDQASAAHEQSLSVLSEHAPESLRGVADRHRGLAIERDKLLQEIRRLPGFEKFLLRKPFSQLRAAAHSGPVAVLNAAKSRCDALIVVAGLDHVIHVPLPNFTSERCANIQIILNRFVRGAREGKKATGKGVSWDDILPPLWQCIVKPVLDALAFSMTPKELSRIFWCPTGPLTFLPIHAAGLYDRQHSIPGHKIFDFVVSSYVPTLALLTRSPGPAAVASGDLRLLAVRQPLSDGQAPLPGVATELARIKDVVENSPLAQTFLVESTVGTVEEVLELMKESDWVHFACHGVQDGVDSGLCLADRRRLTLRDIVAVSRHHGGLAFLSACQTAKGDKKLSDEAIHIAAGMLFAGYGGVIGTMWSISDGLAPRVARDVYLELLGKGKRPDYREAARALQETIRRLRNQEVPISEWIPFIHVGL